MMSGKEREYVVAFDAGGKEPICKLITASKSKLLEKAKYTFGVAGGYAIDYLHPKLCLFIRPDSARDIPDECCQVRLVPIPEQLSQSPSESSMMSTASIVTIQEPPVATTDDVEAFLNPVDPPTPWVS